MMFLLLISVIYLLISVQDLCYRKILDVFPILIISIGLGILVINGDWLEGLTTLGLAVATFFVLAPGLFSSVLSGCGVAQSGSIWWVR